MANPITKTSIVYSGLGATIGDFINVAHNFAFDIPEFATMRVYETASPETELTATSEVAGLIRVEQTGGVPASGTFIVELDVPRDSLVRQLTNGNTFTAGTIEDLMIQGAMLSGAVSEGRLDTLATSLDFGNNKAFNLAAGVDPQDSVNKQQLDDVALVQVPIIEAHRTAAEAAQTGAETAQGITETARDDTIAAIAAAEITGVTDGDKGDITASNGGDTWEINAGAVGTAEIATGAVTANEIATGVVGTKVSSNDTTPSTLEDKLLVDTGLLLSTQNEGVNETRTVAVDYPSQAEAEAGTENTKPMTALRTAEAIAALSPTGGKLLNEELRGPFSSNSSTSSQTFQNTNISESYTKLSDTSTVFVTMYFTAKIDPTNNNSGTAIYAINGTSASNGGYTAGIRGVSITDSLEFPIAVAGRDETVAGSKTYTLKQRSTGTTCTTTILTSGSILVYVSIREVEA